MNPKKVKIMETILEMLEIIVIGDFQGTLEELTASLDAHFDILNEYGMDEQRVATALVSMQKIMELTLKSKGE